jgi:hypothetical protein
MEAYTLRGEQKARYWVFAWLFALKTQWYSKNKGYEISIDITAYFILLATPHYAERKVVD